MPKGRDLIKVPKAAPFTANIIYYVLTFGRAGSAPCLRVWGDEMHWGLEGSSMVVGVLCPLPQPVEATDPSG